MQFILDKPDPFGKLEESSDSSKDMLKPFDPFKIAMESITFKQDSLNPFILFVGDNLEASTSFKDNNQEVRFKMIRVKSILLAFTFLMVVSHITNLFMVVVDSNLKE